MARLTACLPLATGAALAALALALRDPERWEPGARLALAGLALGAGALVPTAAAGGCAAALVAAPLLALGAALEADAVAEVPLRAALALALIAGLGAAAGRIARTGGDRLGTVRRALALALLAAFVALPLAAAVVEAHGQAAPNGGAIGPVAAPVWLAELARWSPLAALYHLPTLPLAPGGARALAGAALALLVAFGARPPRAPLALAGAAALFGSAPAARADDPPSARTAFSLVWVDVAGPAAGVTLHAPNAATLGLPEFTLRLEVDLAAGERRSVLAPVPLVAADIAAALGAPRVPELAVLAGPAEALVAVGPASEGDYPFPRVRPPAPGGPRPVPSLALAAALAPLPLALAAALALGAAAARRRWAVAGAALLLTAVGAGGAVALARRGAEGATAARGLVLWTPPDGAGAALDPELGALAERIDVYGRRAELAPPVDDGGPARRLWLDLADVAGLGGEPVALGVGPDGRWTLQAPRGAWVAATPFEPGARLLRPEVNTWGALREVALRGADGVWSARGDWVLGAALPAAPNGPRAGSGPGSASISGPPGWLLAGLPQGVEVLTARLAPGAYAGPGAPAGAELWLRVVGR